VQRGTVIEAFTLFRAEAPLCSKEYVPTDYELLLPAAPHEVLGKLRERFLGCRCRISHLLNLRCACAVEMARDSGAAFEALTLTTLLRVVAPSVTIVARGPIVDKLLLPTTLHEVRG